MMLITACTYCDFYGTVVYWTPEHALTHVINVPNQLDTESRFTPSDSLGDAWDTNGRTL